MRKTRLDAIAVVVVGAVGCAYRFLAHTSFNNDQFVHLARAQAWLAGDWPIRDFTETGAILTVGLSAAAQALFGQSLLPELLLSIATLGAGAAVTCWAVIRLTGSRALGVLAALLQILVYPRLYSYPKILLYPIGIVLLLRYGDRPTLARLAAAAVWVAISFLFRHDHGVYAGAATVLMIVLVHWREGAIRAARQVGMFLALVLVCVMPFLVYVQGYIGLWTYLQQGLGTSQGEASRTAVAFQSFTIERGPLLVRRPPDAEELPRIHIRWALSVDETARVAHERAVPLLHAEHLEGRTWRYRIERSRTEALRQLLHGVDVEDVDGVNRRSLEFDAPQPFWQAVFERLHVRGLRPGPPITSLGGQAGPLLFYTAWTLPVAAFFLWVRRRNRDRDSSGRPLHADWHIPVLCGLAFLCTAGFQRDEPSIRTPDVFGTFPILLAWVLAETFVAGSPGPGRAARVFAGAFAVIVCASVAWLGSAGERLGRMGLFSGPRAVAARAAETARSARDWPWSGQWPGDEDWRLARYVHDCTRPGDRLLVTWFAPEYYVFSRRPFAGRETVLIPWYRDPATYENRVLESWTRYSVPIVLVQEATYSEFAAAYPALAKHIAANYRRAGAMPSRTGAIDVYIEQGRTVTGRDAELGWECFAPTLR